MRLSLIALLSFTLALLDGCMAQDDYGRSRESREPKATAADGSPATAEPRGNPAYSRDPMSEGRRSPGLP